MDFFFTYGTYLFTPMHVLVCLILIAVVLLQTGKSSDMAGVFGGAGTQTAFGPRGVENTLSKLTRYAAIMFMITSLCLSVIKTRSARDTFSDLPGADEVETPSSGATGAPVATQPSSSTESTAPSTDATSPAAPDESAEPAEGRP